MFISLRYIPLFTIISVVINLAVIYLCNRFKIGIDHRSHGKHKLHSQPIPRLGGIGIYLPFVITFLFFQSNKVADSKFIFVSSLIFVLGVYEDIFKNTSANLRFVMIAAISFLSLLFLDEDAVVKNIGFELPFYFAVLFTVFAFTGIINSINIIDGLNGLASGVSLTVIFFMSLIAYQNSYVNIYNLLFCLGGSLIGFFIINFFTGKIFLGDAGAYFIGFILAVISSIISNRSYGKISPWFFVILLNYPIVDTLFSIYRRLLKKKNVFKADFMHMHTLVYKIVFRDQMQASFFVIVVNFFFSYIGYLFKNNTPVLVGIFLLYGLSYIMGYRLILKKRCSKVFENS
ncbi:MAG: glycosyltransferase family 4 protein [Elusimicrobiales bacterium]